MLSRNLTVNATVHTRVRITDGQGMPCMSTDAKKIRKSLVQKIHEERPRNFLVSYVRDDNNNPYGVVVASRVDTGDGKRLVLGWSRQSNADRRDGLTFEKSFGIISAVSREQPVRDVDPKKIPADVFEEMRRMVTRAVNYYKLY